ncbi:MAG: L-erythro-3,5-diaminohexanoate dehydrogenase [Candidatus Lokiarchaeota archaeon]|nr:L-erythro-3,5-diaminohexanoate dehydrogenase [Candidatus Lokiarchaeota archaeon]MBD3199285.1 L-erythro-3,5-diaminohexanoate dehydrogenase [Candidatus Lokiarchaeota archaeon]
MRKGNKYGTHRVIEPAGALPQAALKISNDMKIFDNEILIDVDYLNIDSASFTQLKEEARGDLEKIKRKIIDIVNNRGKMQNPVTGSGGMLIGVIERIGSKITGKIDLNEGERIATLVSLSLTPLQIDEILDIQPKIDRVKINGKAILFESGIFSKLPEDLDERLSLAVLDVAGAPAQIKKLVKRGDNILILGATGKSGLMCCYMAKKVVGKEGKVIGQARNKDRAKFLRNTNVCDEVIIADVINPFDVLKAIQDINNGKEVDISVNCLSIPNTEMTSILPVKDGGKVYFFSMATSFTKAALGAEGVGKDVEMIIGNGYTKNHAEIALNLIRESNKLKTIFLEKYMI